MVLPFRLDLASGAKPNPLSKCESRRLLADLSAVFLADLIPIESSKRSDAK